MRIFTFAIDAEYHFPACQGITFSYISTLDGAQYAKTRQVSSAPTAVRAIDRRISFLEKAKKSLEHNAFPANLYPPAFFCSSLTSVITATRSFIKGSVHLDYRGIRHANVLSFTSRVIYSASQGVSKNLRKRKAEELTTIVQI